MLYQALGVQSVQDSSLTLRMTMGNYNLKLYTTYSTLNRLPRLFTDNYPPFT